MLMHTILTAANELNVGYMSAIVREMMEAVKAYCQKLTELFLHWNRNPEKSRCV